MADTAMVKVLAGVWAQRARRSDHSEGATEAVGLQTIIDNQHWLARLQELRRVDQARRHWFMVHPESRPKVVLDTAVACALLFVMLITPCEQHAHGRIIAAERSRPMPLPQPSLLPRPPLC